VQEEYRGPERRRIIMCTLLMVIASGCSRHQLDSYDVSLSANDTKYQSDRSDTATTVGGKIDFHFKVKR